MAALLHQEKLPAVRSSPKSAVLLCDVDLYRNCVNLAESGVFAGWMIPSEPKRKSSSAEG